MTWDDESGADDVIDQGFGSRPFALPGWLGFLGPGLGGPGWRPSRGGAVLASGALLVGLAVGYAAGRGTSRAAAVPRLSATSAAPPGNPARPPLNPLADVGAAVAQLPESCSAQSGAQIQLGFEVTNQSGTTLTLNGVHTTLPADKGALSEVSWQWTPCGPDTSGRSQSAVTLPPGATSWLSVALRVHVRCPAADPVQFWISYAGGGVNTTQSLPGFPDLTQIRYSGCPSLPGSSTGSSTFSGIYLGPAGGPVHTLYRGLPHSFTPGLKVGAWPGLTNPGPATSSSRAPARGGSAWPGGWVSRGRAAGPAGGRPGAPACWPP